MKRTRFLAAIMSVTMMSSFIIPAVYAEDTVEKSITPGIETWANPSGTIRRIEGINFDDLISSFGKDAFVYRYYNNKKAIVVTPDGERYHFSNANVWGLSYSVVTMREGTEPPVSEINEKIGAGDELKVKFYRYADSNEYRFYILGEEYADTVLDILKNNKDVVSIENRREITEEVFRLEQLEVYDDIDPEQFIKDYPALDLTQQTGENGAQDKSSGYFLFKFNEYAASHELYDALVRLDKSGVEYELLPLLAMSSGGYKVAEMAEVIYKASGSDKVTDSEKIYELANSYIEQNHPGDATVWIDEEGIVSVVYRQTMVGEPEFTTDDLQKYLQENNVDFSKIKILCMAAATIGNIFGDIDLNGTIDVTDITELSLALLGDRNLSENQMKAADVDGDGVVTLADLARLQQYLSKKIDSLR